MITRAHVGVSAVLAVQLAGCPSPAASSGPERAPLPAARLTGDPSKFEDLSVVGEGEPVPGLLLPTPNGPPLDLSQRRTPLLLVFCGTSAGSPACARELRRLSRVSDRLRARGGHLFAISAGPPARPGGLVGAQDRWTLQAFGVPAQRSAGQIHAFLLEEGRVAKIWRSYELEALRGAVEKSLARLDDAKMRGERGSTGSGSSESATITR